MNEIQFYVKTTDYLESIAGGDEGMNMLVMGWPVDFLSNWLAGVVLYFFQREFSYRMAAVSIYGILLEMNRESIGLPKSHH